MICQKTDQKLGKCRGIVVEQKLAWENCFRLVAMPVLVAACVYVYYTVIVPFYQNSPTPFPGRRPNLGLVCVLLCNLCYLYSLVKMDWYKSF